MDNLIKSKFRVNLHALVAESKYLRKEEKKLKLSWHQASLRNHRTNEVRKELRITNLAFALAKKLPYKKVESSVKNHLTGEDIRRLELKLKRKGLIFTKDQIREWLET